MKTLDLTQSKQATKTYQKLVENFIENFRKRLQPTHAKIKIQITWGGFGTNTFLTLYTNEAVIKMDFLIQANIYFQANKMLCKEVYNDTQKTHYAIEDYTNSINFSSVQKGLNTMCTDLKLNYTLDLINTMCLLTIDFDNFQQRGTTLILLDRSLNIAVKAEIVKNFEYSESENTLTVLIKVNEKK